MSKQDRAKETRDTNSSREVDAVDQKRSHVTRDDIEKFTSIIKGPLYISPEDKADPEFYHCWVDANRPARLDKLLDWGAEIVQKYDRNNKLVNDVCREHGDHMVHVKIPRHIKTMIDDVKDTKRRQAQKQSFTRESEINEQGPAVTTINQTF